MGQRQVQFDWDMAPKVAPVPKLLLFAAPQFHRQATKVIDESEPEKIGAQGLKIQMNAVLLTNDLKKKRIGNGPFWIINQPEMQSIKKKVAGIELRC